ncbi:hypothetical protein [Acidocella sp.]|jgi:hypothetical protein|uniref:hypothetical protein n=1 Tax=Acidocella sp. TaxID=50710 RepID=UPI002F421A16
MTDDAEAAPGAEFGVDHVAVVAVLHQGLELVADLTLKLQSLDDLMLSGRPQEIAAAATEVEAALSAAEPAFSDIADTMKRLGSADLQRAADYLRRADQNDAASLADTLRLSLKRFATRSVKASRRATTLHNGLSAALRSMQALGVEDSGRLIAEA